MSDYQTIRLLQTWRQRCGDDKEGTTEGGAGGVMVSHSTSERSKEKSQKYNTIMRDIKSSGKISNNQKDKSHVVRDTTTTTVTTAATTPSDRLLSLKKQEISRIAGIAINRKSSLEPILSTSSSIATPVVKTHSKTSASWFNPYHSSAEDLAGVQVKKDTSKKKQETQENKQNFIARNKSAAAVFSKARRESQKSQVNASSGYSQASARRRQNVHSAEIAQKRRLQGMEEEQERLQKMDQVEREIEERRNEDGYDGWLEGEEEIYGREQLQVVSGERVGRGQLVDGGGVGSWRREKRGEDIEENSVESDGDKQDDADQEEQQGSKKVGGLEDYKDNGKNTKTNENINKIAGVSSVPGPLDPQKIVSIQEKIKETQLLISHLKLNTNSSILPKQQHQDQQCIDELNLDDSDIAYKEMSKQMTISLENSKPKLDIAAQLADISQMKVVAEEDESQGYADAHDDTLLDFVAHFNGLHQSSQKKQLQQQLQQQQQQQYSQQSMVKLPQNNSSYANIHGKNNSNNNSYQPSSSSAQASSAHNHNKNSVIMPKRVITTNSNSISNFNHNNKNYNSKNNNPNNKKDLNQVQVKQQQQQQQPHHHDHNHQQQQIPPPPNKSNLSKPTSTSVQQRQRMLRHRLSELAVTLRSGSITMEDMREISWIVDMSASFEGTLTPRQLIAFQRITEMVPTTTTKNKQIQSRLSAPITVAGRYGEGQMTETNQKIDKLNRDNELKQGKDRKAQTSYDSVKWVQINKKNNSKSINSCSSSVQQQQQQTQTSQLTRRLRSTKSAAEDEANNTNHNGLKSISQYPLKGNNALEGIVKNTSIRNTATTSGSSQARIRQSHQENNDYAATQPSLLATTTNGLIKSSESHQAIKQDNQTTKQYLVPKTNNNQQEQQRQQHYQQPQRKRELHKISKQESEQTNNISYKKDSMHLQQQQQLKQHQPSTHEILPAKQNITSPVATSALARVADIIHAQVNQKQQSQQHTGLQNQGSKLKQKVSYADLHVLKQKSIKDEYESSKQPVMQLFLSDPPALQITPVHSLRKR